jgi:hypothetical protein
MSSEEDHAESVLDRSTGLKAYGKQLQQLRIDGIYSGITSTREEQYIEVSLTAPSGIVLLSLDGGKVGKRFAIASL